MLNAFAEVNPEFSRIIQATKKESFSLESLDGWPHITLTLEGDNGDVDLTVRPQNYWQLNAAPDGSTSLVLQTSGHNTQGVLGLPLMNNYFCVFDRSADDGQGVIKFAPINSDI